MSITVSLRLTSACDFQALSGVLCVWWCGFLHCAVVAKYKLSTKHQCKNMGLQATWYKVCHQRAKMCRFWDRAPQKQIFHKFLVMHAE